jgi:phosphatidylserine decarboxylase
MSAATDPLFVQLQKVLPKSLLTSIIHWLARIRIVAIKDFLIRRFVGFYKVDIEELRHPVPAGYATFNDFFIRELAPGARTVDESVASIVSPVDGTVSAAGRIDKSRIFQAKGLDYTLTDLLATDTEDARHYIDGSFATIYLAPYNYHRIHAPLSGHLVAARYVPGALFSVNDATVRHLPRLFARNERLICHLQTDAGKMVLILVGAMNVGTIHSTWHGDLRPRQKGVVADLSIGGDSAAGIRKGDTVGWFNMGSTVILLMPAGACDDFDGLDAGQTVQMGQPIGRILPPQ